MASKPTPRKLHQPIVMVPMTSLAFAPDGKLVVACSQAGLHIYNWPSLNDMRLQAAPPINRQKGATFLHCSTLLHTDKFSVIIEIVRYLKEIRCTFVALLFDSDLND